MGLKIFHFWVEFVASVSLQISGPFVRKTNHALTTPETQGTNNGADGCAFLYDSEYESLKFSLGFSACFSKLTKTRILE